MSESGNLKEYNLINSFDYQSKWVQTSDEGSRNYLYLVTIDDGALNLVDRFISIDAICAYP